jgi:hypothetical protein
MKRMVPAQHHAFLSPVLPAYLESFMTTIPRPAARSAAPKPVSRPSALLQHLMARIDGWLMGWFKRRLDAFRLWRSRPRELVRESRSQLGFEALEPRVLLSADLNPGVQAVAAASTSQTFSASTQPSINLTPLIDADGTQVSLDITGPGTAQLIADGAGFTLQLSGSDTSTRITLRASGGDGRVGLTGIAVTDNVGSLDLAGADLLGNATFGGKLASLALGDIHNARIDVAGAGDLTLQAGHITDSQFRAPRASLALTATDWLSGGIEVAAVRTLVTSGDFNADLSASGAGVTGYALGSVQVGGAVSGGVWSIHGRGSSLQAGSTGSDWRANLSGTLVQFITRGDASGALSLAALQLLQVGGSAQGLTLLVGADLGDDSALGGNGINADSFKAGTLARVRITGSLIDSQLLVGLDPVNGVFGDGNDQQLGSTQRLQEFIVGGQVSGSAVVAPAFPATVRIGGVTLAPASLAEVFASTPADTTAPVLSVSLLEDSGADSSDGLTRNPAVLVEIVEAGSVAAIEASFGGSFQAVSAVLQSDGRYLIDTPALAAANGGSLPDGAYALQLRARDAAGNVSRPVGLGFTLDTTAPAFSGLGLDPLFDTGTPGDLSTAADVVALIGQTDPGAIVALGPLGRFATADAGGAFRFANVDLAAGFNVFEFTVTDVAGNLHTTSLTIERGSDAGDVTPPTLSAALVSDTGTLITDSITRDSAIAGQTVDNIGVTQLFVAVDPAATPALTDLSHLLGADGRFTLSAEQLAALAGGRLADGVHSVLIQALDAAGNATNKTVSFTLDTTAPVLSGLALDPASDTGIPGDLSTTATIVSVTGVSSPGDRIRLAQGNLETSADASGAFRFDAVPLALGANVFDFTAFDAAGNSAIGTLTVERTLIPDTTPPNLVVGLANDTGSADGVTRDPSIAGQVSDNIGVAWLEVDASGTGIFTDISSLLQPDGSFTLSPAQLASLAGGPLAEGVHLMVFRVGDAAGGSTLGKVEFTLDTTAPAVSEFGFDPDTSTLGDGSTYAGTVALAGLTEGGARVHLAQGNLETTASPGGAFRFENIALTLGSNLFEITVIDGAGNSATSSLSIERTVPPDTVAPTLTAVLLDDSALPDGITRDARIQVNTADDVGVRRILVALDPGSSPDFIDYSVALVQANGAIPGAFVIDPAQVALLAGGSFGDGVHRVLIRALDAAGNATDAAVDLTLDTTAPVLADLALDLASDTGVAGDLRTSAEVVILTGRASPGDSVVLSGPGIGSMSAVAGANGVFTFADIALQAGNNTFTFSNVDLAGNATQASLSIERTEAPDTSAPTLSATLSSDSGSSSGDGITGNPAITGQAGDNVGVTLLLVAVDPGATPVFIDISGELHAGSFTLTAAQMVSLAGGTLSDGAHTFLFRAVDAAGNSTDKAVSFTLDTAVPTLSLGLDPAFDTGTPGDGSTTAQIVTVIGQTEPGAFVRVVQLNVGTTADSSGNFSIGGISLEPGSNSFDFTVIDAAGNGSMASLTLERTVLPGDTAAPTLLAGLASDTGTSGTDSLTRDPTITGQAGDDTAVAQLLVALDGGATPGFTDLASLLQPDGSFTLGADVLAALAGGSLADGAHTVVIRALDAAGNVTEKAVAFTLDTTGPDAASFGIASADALGGDDSQASAGRVLLRGQAPAGALVSLAAQGLSTVAGQSGAFQLANVELVEGANVLSLTIADAAGNSRSVTRTVTRVVSTRTDAVLAWNTIALQSIQRDATDPPVATRILAIQSLAVYDTLAAIEGTPAFIVQRSVSGPVSADAAVAEAAYRVLYQLYPAQRSLLDAALAASLAGIADGAAKDNGVALGRSIADAVLASRANDGYLSYTTEDGSTVLGKWRPTGPMYLVADNPQWGGVTPFVLTAGDEFRAPPPPSLDSAEYASAINEVQSLGSATSATRTADQTQQALFWADGGGSYTPPGHWNQIATTVAQAQGNSLSANARLFAQLNVALADAAIACWDTKYTYDAWRPETAIQLADQDGNAATTVDANWRPLLLTPPHPTYVSGHSTFSAAAAGILAATFGDNTAFSTTSATLPGVTRSFTSFSQAADEAGLSRIYGGIHTSLDNEAGKAIGAKVADAVLAKFKLTTDTQAPTTVLDDSKAVANTNLTFTGQLLDNLSGVASAQYRIDSGNLQPLTFDTNGKFSITTTFALDGTQDGTHSLTIIARDAAGNISAGYNRSFILDTKAPIVSLPSLADGATLTDASHLTGSADATGSSIVQLSYSIDGGAARSLVFDSAGGFDQVIPLGDLALGAHTLNLSAQDAAGNVSTLSRSVTLEQLAAFTITELTPSAGSSDVGVTYRPRISFSRAVDASSLTSDSLYATAPDGSKIAATLVPALDGSFVWMLFTNPLPGASTITLHVDGSLIRAANGGALLDANGDGTAGGSFTTTFTTVSTAGIAGTKLVGKVVDPGVDLEPMTFDDIRRGPDGVIHTADDVFLNPIAHAKVWILGQEDKFVYTDVNGNFELADVPVGTVKVAIDGRTATNAPTGVFFPEMVMDVTLRPGVTNTIMDSMGTTQEQLANQGRPEIYLPRVPTSILQTVSNTGTTTVTVDETGAPQLTDEERANLKMVVAPGSAIGENGQILNNVQIGMSTVPPELVQDMLPPGVLQHTFDITIQAPGVTAFAQPVQITFPNVFNAAPGTKLNILSFDHTTGKLVINGTATVSADGKSVTSDEGSGIRAPGWHGLAALGALLRNLFPGFADWLDDPCVNAALKLGSTVAGVVGLAASSPAWATGAAVAGVGFGVAAFASDVLMDQTPESGGKFNASGAVANYYGKRGAAEYQRINDKIVRVSAYGSTSTSGLSQVELDNKARILNRLDGINGARQAAGAQAGLRNLGKALGAIGTAINFGETIQAAANCLGSNPPSTPAPLRNAVTGVQQSGRELLDKMESIQKAIDEAFDEVIADGIQRELGEGPDGSLWCTSDGSDILVFDGEGDPIIDPSTGAQKRIPIQSVISPDVRQPGDAYNRYLNAIQKAQHRINGAPDNGGQPNSDQSLDKYLERFLRSIEALTAVLYESVVPSGGDTTPRDLCVLVQDSTSGNVVFQGSYSSIVQEPLLLGANRAFTIELFSLGKHVYGEQTIIVPSGVSQVGSQYVASAASTIPLMRDISPDSDGDGLSDNGERVCGTNANSGDSDLDGISDLAELLAGTSPLDGRPRATGVLATLPVSGEAKAISPDESLSLNTEIIAVATGSHGVSFVDVSRADKPSVLREVDLPGDSTDVAFDGVLGYAAVASNADGLSLVDLNGTVRNVAINAHVVEIVDGIVYANNGGEMRAYDLLTGERLQTLSLGMSPIVSLARDGQTLYTIDSNRLLRVVDLSSGSMVARGSVVSPAAASSLFAANGVVYAAAEGSFAGGYATIDVSNPDAPKLLSGIDANSLAAKAIALNGSGLAVSVGSPGRFGNLIQVLDASDPTNTGAFLTQYTLAVDPYDVSIAAGLAYVADGTGGLVVVNYRAFDTQGQAPVVSATAKVADLDPNTDGIQVQEGKTIQIVPTVTDDVQVRDVALLLNGKVVRDDLSFPFDLSVNLPTIAANGGNTVTLQVRATDTGGNSSLSAPIVLKLVPDTVAPVLVSSNVTEGTSKGRSFRAIDLVFSESLDAATINASTVRLIGPDGNAVPAPQIQFRQLGREVQLTFDPLPLIGNYRLVIDAASVTDRAGNALGAAQLVTNFTVKSYSAEWVGPAGGFWDVAANWSNGVVPTAGDDVFVGLPAGASITFRSGTISVATLTSDALINVTGGSLTVIGESQLRSGLHLTNGSFTFAGDGSVAGGLQVAGGTLTANGALDVDTLSLSGGAVTGSATINVARGSTWSGGTLRGTGSINFNGDLAIAGTATKLILDGRVISLNATTTWGGNTAVNNNRIWFGAGTINNNGTFIDANGFSTWMENYYSGTMVFNNAGTYRKTTATTSTLDLQFNNTGTVDLQAGVFDLFGGSNQASSVLLDSDATLLFRAGMHTLNGLTVTGAGRFEVGGTYDSSTNVIQTGNLTLAGQLALTGGTLTNSGTLNVASFAQTDGDSVLTGAGTLTVAEAATWSAGVLRGTGTLNFNGDLAISGDAYKYIFDGRVINLGGTTTWSGNTVAGNNRLRFGAGTINNAGTFIDANVFNSFMENYYSGTLAFNNTGTFRKLNATTTTLDLNFDNSGTTDIRAGVFDLTGNSTQASEVQLASAATLRFRAGTHDLTGLTVTGDGTVEVAGTYDSSTNVIQNGNLTLAGGLLLSGGTLTSNGTLAVASFVQSDSDSVLTGAGIVSVAGAATWSAGVLRGTGTLNFNGDLAISGDAYKYIFDGRVINLGGTTTWSGNTVAGNNRLRFGAGTINNAGTFIDANVFNSFMENYYSGTLAFNNTGTFRKLNATTTTLDLNFDNSGTTDIRAGVFDLTGNSTQASEVQLASAATLRFRAGTHDLTGLTVTGDGTVEVAGTYDSSTNVIQNGNLTLAGKLQLSGGTLTSNGTLTVASFVQTDSDSVLTGAGTVTVAGAATWSAGTLRGTGTLNFNGDVAISGDTYKYIFDGRVINLGGTTTWSGNTVAGSNRLRFGAGTINNAGTFIDANVFNSFMENYYSGTLAFNNTGTFRKGNDSITALDVVFNNEGTLDVQRGTASLFNGGISDGSFSIAAGATLRLGGGTHVWQADAVVASEGSLLIDRVSSSNQGSLSMLGNVSVQSLDLRVGGALAGTGTLTITGTGSEWTGGLMTGGGTTKLAVGADLTLSGNARKYLGNRTIDNLGTLIEASTGDLVDFEGAAVLNNAGVFDIRSDIAWQNYTGASGSLTLNNSGTLKKSAGTGDFFFLNTGLNNSGTVDVQTGTLAFGGGTGSSSGQFKAAAGSEVVFVAGTQTLTDGATASGAGALAVRNLNGSTGGTLQVSGAVQVERLKLGYLGTLTGTGTLTITGTGSEWTAGLMTGGGTTKIASGADLTLSGKDRKYLGNRTIDNLGTLIEASTGDLVDFEGAAVLNNAGVFDIRSDIAWQNYTGASGSLTLNNSGTLKKSAGTGDFFFLNTGLNNSGTVDVQTGTLAFGGGTGSSSGQFKAAAGSEVVFVAGTQTLTDGATASGAGALAVRNLNGSTGGTLQVSGAVQVERLKLGYLGTLTGTGTLTITGTGSEWTAGLMTGGGTTKIASGADLTLSGKDRKYLGNRTIDNLGTLIEASTGDLVDFEGAAVLNNAGVFDIRSDIAWQNYTGASGSLTLNNSGMLKKSAGVGTFTLAVLAFSNKGSIEVKSGTLKIGTNIFTVP